MTIADTVDRIVSAYGTAHTLRKDAKAAGANSWTVGASTVTYNACRAKGRGYKPVEIRAGIQENDELVVVSAASLPDGVVPAVGDRISSGTLTADLGGEWRQVINVHETTIAGVVHSYRLQVRR